MSAYLTVKDAALLTGKSTSSIRRAIYPILEKDQHPDRHHIQPSVKEAMRLRVKGENFAWRVSEELLRRQASIGDKTSQEHTKQRNFKQNDDMIGMLRRELDIKNGQITTHGELIAKQMELISGLSERLREGNLLIGSLQQQLALGDGSKNKQEVIETTQSEPRVGESPKENPKRGWFSRMFRS